MDFTVEVRVELKKGVLDAEGETIAKSLKLLGFPTKRADSIKLYRVVVNAKDRKDAERIMSEAASKLLANPVIQDYYITVV